MERTKTQTGTKTKMMNLDGTRRGRKLFETRNDLPQETRQKMVDLLNGVLADSFDLFSQTKHAHWNVKGQEFIQLHKLYDELAEILLGHIDKIAERATALGGTALGTVRMAGNSSRLEEYPDGAFGSLQSVAALADRYSSLGATVREGIETSEKEDDMVTNDLLIEVTHDLDKGLWFLESHLQGGER